MNADDDNGTDRQYRHAGLTRRIIGAAFEVYNALGAGFAEKVYENALVIELAEAGIAAEQQHAITVYYRGQVVGEYVADIMVDGKVIVEVKAVSDILPVHEVQVVNYLKATGLEVGLIVNFGPEITFKRRILSADMRKPAQ